MDKALQAANEIIKSIRSKYPDLPNMVVSPSGRELRPACVVFETTDPNYRLFVSRFGGPAWLENPSNIFFDNGEVQ